ncbi:MAG: hypothetical protein K940chlam1_00336 [Candidatus Anoxychlamydiales bacterium]|nr:hypothetical protein [Candidatus Anoxychlamydiales bacterium]NGX35285.1 hypothetical protein [Candidatus Anoxychlamydiales bacterium]
MCGMTPLANLTGFLDNDYAPLNENYSVNVINTGFCTATGAASGFLLGATYRVGLGVYYFARLVYIIHTSKMPDIGRGMEKIADSKFGRVVNRWMNMGLSDNR